MNIADDITSHKKTDPGAFSVIVEPLLQWYNDNARDLPWRKDTDPYHVWVSEIMLQQTRVETVISYYHRFIELVPDIKSLAELPEEQLLKLWEGLGYYRRVRSMQRAAQTIMEKYHGKFPDSLADILSLTGIGDYTAGAIASICFELPVPAVDGNVLRVIARLTGYEEDISSQKTKNEFTELLRHIYPVGRCGDFTQSLMELGATVCLPNGSPKCSACPLARLCLANMAGSQMLLPVKSKKPPRKKERITVFLLCCDDRIAVRQRDQNTLLGGLWEFPNIPGSLSLEQVHNTLAHWKVSASSISQRIYNKHTFTHIEWDMIGYIIECEHMAEQFIWVTRKKLSEELALPSAFQPFFNIL